MQMECFFYERGVEEMTWGCGTGATAAFHFERKAGNIRNGQEIRAMMPGGTLILKTVKEGIMMSGKVEELFTGIMKIS